jgi:tRNA-uridine 2-sulfurtransferase
MSCNNKKLDYIDDMKILVGLSGWVDSAVAAYLLQQEGHEVVAGFMLNYLNEDDPSCTTKQDLESFHAVRKHLRIEAYEIFDYREEYEQRILNYIYEGYQQWITPNPDVYCNSLVKFDLFLKEAMQMWFDAIATGHYAQIVESWKLKVESFHLFKGVDASKDQSYFLSQLNQEQLSKAIFPLWGMNKSDVRLLAHQIWLPNADRPDSQGLCFVGKVKMGDFLAEKLWPKPWNIVDLQWTVVGHHEWAYRYTIGQRRWLYLPFQAYVSDVNVLDNVLTVARVGEEDVLLTDRIVMHNPHRISGEAPQPWAYQCKIRYRQEAKACELQYQSIEESKNQKSNGSVWILGSFDFLIRFHEPIKWVANGQIVVIYDGDEVVGSGVIVKNSAS